MARNHARQRCIPFDLSFKEYKEIWIESGKWEEKLAGGDWTMDRKEVNEGYRKGNVRIVPMSLNVRVWHDEQKWNIDFRWRKMWSKRNKREVELCPF